MQATNILSYGEEIKALQAGGMCAPRFADLHLSNRCSQHCVGCAYAGQHDGRFMSVENSLLVIDELRALGVRAIFAEKVEGRLELRRFRIRPGERFVVAEDVVTRGGRVQETIDIVKDAGGEPVAVVVLADGSGGRARFPVPLVSLIQVTPETWPPEGCPLCREGLPLVHPGS